MTNTETIAMDNNDTHFGIPRIIHQTWKTATLPAWAHQWFASWRHHHPDFAFKLWTDEDNRALVAATAPWFLKTYDDFPIHIQRVDSVRYLILYLFGGVYVDLDFECFKDISPLLGHDLVLSYSSNLPCITNAIMMSKPKHPFWLKLLKTISKARPKHILELKSYYVMRSTGPLMLHRVAQRCGVLEEPGTYLLPKLFFFPFSMLQKDRRFRSFPHSYGAHQHMCTWTTQHQTLKWLAIGGGTVFVATIALCVGYIRRQRALRVKR
jgi:mannosyltransferase OCH1-like enzyme